jgi:hypothetical protein
MSKKLHRAVVLTKFNPKKDKSATITFETLEQTPEDIGELHALTGTFGYLVFKSENQLTDTEIKDISNLETELRGKTKSKRLMNVLFRLHEQQGEGDFDTFYANKMESIINQIKNKLD